MWEMKSKVPQERLRSTHILAQDLAQDLAQESSQESSQESAKQSDQRPAGGVTPAHPRTAGDRENIVSRLWRFSPWILVVLAAAPVAPAGGQNLDAGKSGSQIFAEVCANCHKSPRELRSNAGASFLREHYTTGSDMASTMSAYLSGAGSASGAQGAPQQKRPPNSVTPGATTTAPTARDAPATRETPAVDPSRDPRRAQQTAEPKVSPTTPTATTRVRPASATAEIKPPPAPPPAKPPLEEFEE
jgi:mono/diheme cytochrome c family protein